MISNQFYSVINPNVGEFVLVHFIERTDSFFDAVLLEYQYRGMMSYQDATKKRKIYNWSKVVPLNKDMVARVDEVDINANIVQLSLAHLDEEFKETLSLSDIQNKLMVQFNENKILDHFITSVSVVNQIDKNQIWINLIYYIDSERRLQNEENDEDITLWKYFTINFNMIDNWCKSSNLDNQLCESIKCIYSKRFNNKCKYVSKIGIISPNGINITKDILKKILKDITYKYTFNYDSAPNYLFESNSDDSNKTDHEKIISELKKYSEIFIKIDYIAKEF
jgi:translation initiation factor 2 alpha subunit (eIF-2alpha)